ncbi:hypothetical protein [Qingshengfaniella alkalisoli]|uniref:Uncharacterized protein n=1 Tax=Qingshengfaniella alkalisoli TaxID=2599296 RepID=A0A5B8IYZ6_9RHOB|nr:hypothetical protein [Qingshengfaniella alkalisoli]QDY70131.1 hypothetical protein FPZ52_11195 [Qingshengfaniella alkalisoli]
MGISIGHVISVVTALALMSVAWGRFETRQDSMADDYTALETRMLEEVAKARAAREALDARTRYVEQQAARTDERFTLILASLSELKVAVKEERR